MCCIDAKIINRYKQLQNWINMNEKGIGLSDNKTKNNLIKGIELMTIEKVKLQNIIIQHDLYHEQQKKRKGSINLLY